MPTYDYNPNNDIQLNQVTEVHNLTPANDKSYSFIIPNAAPFHLDGITIDYIEGNNTRELAEFEFYTIMPYRAATLGTGNPIYGGIAVNLVGAGALRITYNTLGGPWVIDQAQALQTLLDQAYNPRTIFFDQISNIQDTFPPEEHDDNLASFIKVDELIAAISRIAPALSNEGKTELIHYLTENISVSKEITELKETVRGLELRLQQLGA